MSNETGTGYILPVRGGRVTNPYGARQARAPGMTGSLPSSNVGVDIAGQLGAPALAPIGGTVESIYQAQSPRNVNENHGYGGSVVIRGDDGRTHRLSHFAVGSIAVKPGQRIAQGQQIAQVGATGNTDDGRGGPFAHVDWEKRGGSGFEDPMTAPFLSFSEQALGPSGAARGAGPVADQGTPAAGAAVPSSLRRLQETLAAVEKRRTDLAAKLEQYRAADQSVRAASMVPEPPVREGGPLGLGGYLGLGPETAEHRAWRESMEQATTAMTQATAALGSEQPETLQRRLDAADDDLARAQKAVSDHEAELTAAAAKTQQPRTQVVGNRLVNLDTGAVITTFPAGDTGQIVQAAGGTVLRVKPDGTVDTLYTPPEVPGAAETRELSLETARVNLERSRQQLAEARSPEAQRTAQITLEAAEIALRRAQQQEQAGKLPQPVNAAATQEYLLERDPTTGEYKPVRNPVYRAPPAQVIQPGTAPVITVQDPTTGAITTQPNPAYRAPLPQDPYAAYTQERQRIQQAGERQIAALEQQQRAGALSAPDAEQRFSDWYARESEQLAGLRAAAEEAQRKEQLASDQAQRAEQQRVETINRQREQYAFEQGEQARQQVEKILPDVRTPQFLQQYGGLVSSMAARAAAPNARAAANLPAPPPITADTFNPANFRGAIPDLNAVARQRAAEALAAISPAAAMSIQRPLPRLPQAPDLSALLARVPYQGPLLAAPAGVQPLPGQGALDLGTGMARSRYPGGAYLDWAIPG